MAAVGLKSVLVLPTGNPPHKQDVSPAEDRWRMICAATAQDSALTPCRLELERRGVIYTVDTLRQLRDSHPKAELYYIIGADTLLELQHWRDYRQVLGMCTFLVCPRVGAASPAELTGERRRLAALGGRFITVDMEPVEVSSTAVRQQLLAGEPAPCGAWMARARACPRRKSGCRASLPT